LNFRSDSQRKAMFASMNSFSTIPGRNCHNSFTIVPLNKKYRAELDKLYDLEWAEEETLLHEPLEKAMMVTDETSKDVDVAKSGVRLIVDDDDKIQGMVEYDKPSKDGYMFMNRIVVFPDDRGKGVGSGALKEIFESEPDAEYIVGDSEDEKSDKFWEKMGAELSHPYGDRFKNARVLLGRKAFLDAIEGEEEDDV